MGILDDAIKEHLELKRQHGADDSELRKLEDEAFGESERPGEASEAQDSLGEAPTEFMVQPDLDDSVVPETGSPGAAPAETELSDTEGGSFFDQDEPDPGPRSARSEGFDLQEPPEASSPSIEAPESEQPPTVEADLPPDAATEEPPPAEPPEVADEESPAMEHDAFRPPDVSDAEPAVEPEPPAEAAEPPPEAAPPPPEEAPPESPSHSTAEREAIAEQPTELFDVEGEMGPSGGEDPSGGPAPAPPRPPGPTPDELDDFFDDKRLSDELDQALDAPIEDDYEEADEEDAGEEEYDEDDYEEEAGEEGEEEEPRADASGRGEEEGGGETDSSDPSLYEAERGDDVLEETPDFLEEAPEDDRLWFEQKPPKDFDFDD